MYKVEGKHSIIAAIKNQANKLIKLYVKKTFYNQINDILPKNLVVFFKDENALFIHKNHLSVKEICEKYRRIIILDGIIDPRNIGSIIRTAAYMNFAVLVREFRSCSLNSTVFKCASGGCENTDIKYFTNIFDVFKTLKKSDFWITGLSENGENNLEIKDFDKIAFVIGSEEKGISKNTLKNIDFLYKIDGINNDFTTLNASIAAGIIMYKYKI